MVATNRGVIRVQAELDAISRPLGGDADLGAVYRAELAAELQYRAPVG